MSNAKKTFDLFSVMGVFAGLQTTSLRFANSRWQVWGSFQDNTGRRVGILAEFDSADDAVDFQVLCDFDA